MAKIYYDKKLNLIIYIAKCNGYKKFGLGLLQASCLCTALGALKSAPNLALNTETACPLSISGSAG